MLWQHNRSRAAGARQPANNLFQAVIGDGILQCIRDRFIRRVPHGGTKGRRPISLERDFEIGQ